MASESCAPADVLVLGAGPAGSATALGLVRRGVPRVLLVDRPPRAPFAIGESAAPSVAPALAALGLPADLARLGHAPCHGNLSLWGGPEPVVEDFLRRGVGHGYHLDRAAFDAWLRAAAVAGGAALVSPAELEGVERAPRGFHVTLRHAGRTLSARATVLVDATGRKAALARRLGARRRHLDRMVALAVQVAPSPGGGSLDGLSLVESVAEGWWYAAGLPSGQVMLALMTDDDLAREGDLRTPAAYRRALEATARVRGAVALPGDDGLVIASFSAASQYVDRALGAGWLSVGDALLGLDPLTSSGIAGALDDARAAVDTIVGWRCAPDGAAAALVARRYAARAEATLRRFLAERHAVYGRERRWADQPFWARRRAQPRGATET